VGVVFKIIKKLLELFYGYPIYLVSFLIPRDPKKIVVGSHTPFNDNSKYFFILSQAYLPEYEIIWITQSKEVEERIKNLGLSVYRKNRLKGLYHTLTAKFYIYSFHLIDINFWTSGGSIKFNLWHGIPLKDIAFAIKSGPSAKLYNEKSILSRIIRPQIFVRPDFMLTTSDEMSGYFAHAFRIDKKQCLKYGMPRCDILSWSKSQVKEFIHTYESDEMLKLVTNLTTYEKVFIYMPTWRENVDFLDEAGFDFVKLNQTMQDENKLFIFKLHPFSKLKNIKLDEIDAFSNLMVLDGNMDVYPILPFTDCLISDYSSIYYDYLLCENKEIYLYPYDHSEYVLESRDLAFDYNESMPGLHIENFGHLLNMVKCGKNSFSKEQIKIREKYFKEEKGRSVNQLCQFLKGMSQ